MRWPSFWPSQDEDKAASSVKLPDRAVGVLPEKTRPVQTPSENPQRQRPLLDWHAFLEPQTLIPTIVLTTACLGAYKFYSSYLRRLPAAGSIGPGYLRKRSVFGKVTSVGDGDNFRIYHTPGGWIAGWGWLRSVPTDKKSLKSNTVRT